MKQILKTINLGDEKKDSSLFLWASGFSPRVIQM